MSAGRLVDERGDVRLGIFAEPILEVNHADFDLTNNPAWAISSSLNAPAAARNTSSSRYGAGEATKGPTMRFRLYFQFDRADLHR